MRAAILIRLKNKCDLKARFASADGLREGAEVQLAGVRIGNVEQVRFLPPDSPETEKVEAVFKVAETLDGRPISERIRTDSTAQLVATSVLGNDKMINISPGTVKGDPVPENHVLNSSTAISINQLTSTGNDLLQQINKIAIPANEILNKANRGEGSLGEFINNESFYNNLDTTVGEAKVTMLRLQNVLEQVRSGNGTAGKLFNDPRTLQQLQQHDHPTRNHFQRFAKRQRFSRKIFDRRSALQRNTRREFRICAIRSMNSNRPLKN